MLLGTKLRFIIMDQSPSKASCSCAKVAPQPNKVKMPHSTGKSRTTISRESEGILFIDYKDEGVSLTGAYHASILQRLKEVIQGKSRNNCQNVSCSCTTMPPSTRVALRWLPYPSYSPDLANYFCLSKRMKIDVRGKKLTSDKEVKDVLSTYISYKDKTFSLYIHKLIESFEKWTKMN